MAELAPHESVSQGCDRALRRPETCVTMQPLRMGHSQQFDAPAGFEGLSSACCGTVVRFTSSLEAQHQGGTIVECEVCKVRSAVGRCEDTHALVCEECSTGCYSCGKLVVASKAKITKSGHAYCGACYEKRAARKAGRQQQSEQGSAVQQGAVAPGTNQAEGEAEGQEEVVVLSKWTAPPPWKMSAILAGVALVVMVLLLVFPSVAVIPLGSSYVYTAVPLLFIPILAVVWAIIGLVSREHYYERPRCYIGMGLAVLAFVVAVFTMKPPAASIEQELLRGNRQTDMTPEQRAEWRQRMLSGQRDQK